VSEKGSPAAEAGNVYAQRGQDYYSYEGGRAGPFRETGERKRKKEREMF